MNIIVKRKFSSVVSSDIVKNNICQGKYKNLCNTTSRNNDKHKNKKNKNQILKDSSFDKEEHVSKRHKKTHYNEKMEPIRLSSTNTFFGIGSAESGFLPKRIREVVWNTYNGETYSSKCYVPWCNNIINVFNYQVGHDIPESKGGTYNIGNLRPICSNCNLSMGNKWTIQEWGKLVNSGQEQIIKMQTQNEKDEKTESPAITPATTSRITLITLLFLALNFMII